MWTWFFFKKKVYHENKWLERDKLEKGQVTMGLVYNREDAMQQLILWDFRDGNKTHNNF